MQPLWKQAVTKCPGGTLLPPRDLIHPRPVWVMQTLSPEARTAEKDGKPQKLRRQAGRGDLPKLSLKKTSEGRIGWGNPTGQAKGFVALGEQAGWELGCLTFALCTLGPTASSPGQEPVQTAINSQQCGNPHPCAQRCRLTQVQDDSGERQVGAREQ